MVEKVYPEHLCLNGIKFSKGSENENGKSCVTTMLTAFFILKVSFIMNLPWEIRL
jgi:hypothetical protein